MSQAVLRGLKPSLKLDSSPNRTDTKPLVLQFFKLFFLFRSYSVSIEFCILNEFAQFFFFKFFHNMLKGHVFNLPFELWKFLFNFVNVFNFIIIFHGTTPKIKISNKNKYKNVKIVKAHK